MDNQQLPVEDLRTLLRQTTEKLEEEQKRAKENEEKLLEEQGRAKENEEKLLEEQERAKATEEKLLEEQERLLKRARAAEEKLLEDGNDTTFQGLLDSRMPNMKDLAEDRKSSTIAVASFIPENVVAWSLREPMAEFRAELSEDLLKKPARKMTRPAMGEYEATDESHLVAFFAETACKALDLLCSLSGIEISTKSSGADQYRLFSKGPKPDISCSHAQKLLLCGEAKKGNLTSKGHNLVQRYAAKDPIVKKLIYQITGYQVTYKTEFGFITNYFHTWITKLGSDGTLHISEAFHSSEIGQNSALNALFFAVNAAVRSRQRGDWSLPTLRRSTEYIVIGNDNVSSGQYAGDTGTDRSQDKDDGDAASTNLPLSEDSSIFQGRKITLTLQSILQRHPDRITYLAAFEDYSRAIMEDDDSRSVVVKCYSNRESRDLEVFCYKKLLPLQGTNIPKFVSSGTLNDNESSRRFALVLEWVGEDLAGQESSFPPRLWKQIRDVVIKMHELGVVHGDLESRNMTYDKSNNCVFVYDFSSALTLEGLGSKAFAEACASELDSLDSLVSSIVVSQAD